MECKIEKGKVKKSLNSEKGITLIILIATIIILIILASIATYEGIKTYQYSKVVKFTTYMQTIQKDVDSLAEKGETKGTALTADQQNRLLSIIMQDDSADGNNEIATTDVTDANLRYFDATAIQNTFKLENVQDEIIINFSNREIISLNGIEYKGKVHYTQYKLPSGEDLIAHIETIRNGLTFNTTKTIDGLNATIALNNISITNGTLLYREKGTSNWTTITEKTNTARKETIEISKTGTYEIKLLDNTNGTDNYSAGYPEIQIVLANPPVLETGMTMTSTSYDYAQDFSHWAYATDGINNYFWVPRAVYETTNNTSKYVRGTTNIGTDESFLDNTWLTSRNFENGKTGYWAATEIVPATTGIDVYILPVYSITYDYSTNGGTSATRTKATCSEGDTVNLSLTATKEDWTFVGWNTDKNATTGLTSLTVGRQDITLYAIYSKTITVAYDANGGTGGTTESKTIYNTATTASFTIQPSSIVSREYYNFNRWSTSSDGTGTTYTAGTEYNLSSSITLYAIWTIQTRTVTYNYSANGGTSATVTSANVDIGANINLTPTATKSGWTFVGWNTSSTATTALSSLPMGTTDITLYAIYKKTITITYSANGGTGSVSAQSTTIYNTTTSASFTIKSSSGISRTYYDFNKWNTSSNGAGTTYTVGTTYNLSSSITLYAIWTARTHTVTYNYSTNGGTSATTTSATVQEGSGISLSPTATKSGWTFVGWNTSSTATTKLTSLTMGTSNVTLYAIYSKTITIAYNTNGGTGTVNPQTATMYNNTTSVSITLSNSSGITCSGWKFCNWNTLSDGSGTKYKQGQTINVSDNMTLYASSTHSWRKSGDTITCNECNTNYTLGTTISYTPNTSTSSTTLVYAKSGYSSTQTISRVSSTWVVLGIEDKDNDGTNERLLITAQSPLSTTVYFRGAISCNYAVSELHRICNELYSYTPYGEARSMTMNDVDKTFQYTPRGGFYSSDGTNYICTGNFTTQASSLSFYNYITNYGTSTPDGTSLAYTKMNSYWYQLSGTTAIVECCTNPNTKSITTVEKQLIFGASNNWRYWLATCTSYARSYYVAWSPGGVWDNTAYSACYRQFSSDTSWTPANNGIAIRPVVSLK